MAHAIFADYVASITELKKDPMGTFASGNGEPIAILNRNEPAFYVVPPSLYAQIADMLDDAYLVEVARERLATGERRVRATINPDSGELEFEKRQGSGEQ